MNKPIIVERYADNGSLSHYALIQEETGELLWSEAPEEEMQQVKNCSIPFVSESSFNDEKFIKALFAEYNKSYVETKQGQHYPQWLNDEQLKWVLKVANNCC